MKRTTYLIPKMDCAVEEQLIRLKLQENSSIRLLSFDLSNRTLTLYHEGSAERITKELETLRLGATPVETIESDMAPTEGSDSSQTKALIVVLTINFGFFVVELLAGFLSGSMGLIADSLDMLADALVYGIALFAIGGALAWKKAIAKVSGYVQMGLALIGFMEVFRRFFGAGEPPEHFTMIVVSMFALLGNAACLVILRKAKSDEAHIRASMIFTSNDIVANIGVIVAGIAVMLSGTNVPDLLIGTIVFFFVLSGALRILRLAR